MKFNIIKNIFLLRYDILNITAVFLSLFIGKKPLLDR